ncbi:MAG TPA: endonuclease [Candidatus Cloacimonadota bacterium]|nr:endonuclease [Candidatus Cloacimonadota bacterium]
MKKLIFLIVLSLLMTGMVWGQTAFTATYTFGANGNVSSFTYNGTTYPGITMGTIDKVGVNTSLSSGNFRATNWSLGAIDMGKYIGFTISANTGYKFTVESITFGLGRSGTGTRDSQWRGSNDSYATLINNYTSLNSGLTNNSGVLNNPDENLSWTGNVLSMGTTYSDITETCGFRYYMYNAEATGGTAGLQGPITITGTYGIIGGVNVPPEITNIIQTPLSGVTSTTSVSVSATVTDDSAIQTVQLKWGTSTSSYPNTINMSASGSTYTTVTSIPAQADGTTVYYVVYAADDDSDSSTSPERNYTVRNPSTTTIPYTQDFATGFADTYTIGITGTNSWYLFGESASCNGYGIPASEQWLVLPGINFNNYTNERMTFNTIATYGQYDANNYLKLFYSANYPGVGNPNGYTWTELAFDYPTSPYTSTPTASTSSGILDLSAISGTNVFLAFKYNSTDLPTRWQVDDINIYVSGSPTITVSTPSLSGFTYALGSGPSAEQSFTVSGADLERNLSIYPPANFEASTESDGEFTVDVIRLTPVDGVVANTPIYIRLVSGLAIDSYSGNVSISSNPATPKEVALSGSVTTPPPPDAPVATDASGVASDGFTANWNAASGATGYYLDVYSTGAALATNLIISEYIEGTSYRKAIEIYNGTGAPVDLSAYSLKKQTNGAGDFGSELALSGTLPNDDVYVVAYTSATVGDYVTGDMVDLSINHQVVNFNGNDAVALYHNGTQIDMVGIVNQVTPNWGADMTLVRKPTVTSPTTTFSFDDWNQYAVNTLDYLGSHTMGSMTYVTGYENYDAGNVTQKAISGLTPETTYNYVVRAYNAYGTSDDSNEITVQTLEAAEAPAAPVATSATEIGVNSFIANWNASSGATSYRLDVSTVNTFASFVAGYNNLTVNGTNQTVSGLAANTPYYYRVRAYNVYGTSDNSNTITATTLASDPFGGYYNPVAGLSGSALKSGLRDLLPTNTNTNYDGAKLVLFQDMDNVGGVVKCVYTGETWTVNSLYNGSTNPNTEHTYAQSWFDGTASESVKKADLHHLFITNSSVNSSRSNYPFDEVTNVSATFSVDPQYVSKRGTNADGRTVWEPADPHKGNLARAMLYFHVRYDMPLSWNGVDMLETMLDWNTADPVDADELARNAEAYTYQGNRNFFIDKPQYITSIWGGAPANTVVQFNPASAMVNEGDGTVSLSVEILNPSATNATTAQVVLTSGDAADIGNYTTANLTFPAGSSTPQTVVVTITDDSLLEGTETLIFTLSNVSGGDSATAGFYGSFSLAILDNDIPVPVATDATDPSMEGFTANWNASVGITDFEFDLSTSNTFATFVPGYEALLVTGTSLPITGLNAGTTYFYRLRAVYNESVGANSNVIEASTEAAEGLLLEENFAYTAGLLLTETGNWNNHSGTSNYIPVVASNLTYTSYPSITGNSASLTTTGEDVNRTFATQNSGSVYTSFLVNVTSAQTTGDYIFHYIPETYNTLFFRGRVFIQKESSSNNFRFGLSNGGAIASAVSTGYDYSYGNTYLVVLKYDFVEGDNNDVVSMWVNPTISTTEPAAQLVSTDPITTEPANLSRIALRQGSSSAAPALIIDGIRVATGWEYLFPSAPAVPTVTVSTEALTGFTYVAGSGPSAEQNFTVSGTDLEGNITLTPPTNYEISTVTGESFLPTNPVILSPTEGTVGNTTIYVRLKANLDAGDFNSEQIVIATTGVTPDKTVTCSGSVTEPVVTPNLFISEYIEGSVGNNKAIEIFNASGDTVDMTQLNVKVAANGGAWGSPIVLTGTLANHNVYVLANTTADAAILALANQTSGSLSHNGDDAVGLFYGDTLIDAVGVQGVDPGDGWEVAGVANGTKDHTLIRKSTVTQGNTNWTSSAGTDADDSEWIVQASEYFADLGVHTFGAGPQYTAAPVFDPMGGTFTTAINVSLSCSTENSTIRYTVDGSTPTTETGTVYENAIPVVATTMIKAIAYADGYEPSAVVSQTYTINIPAEYAGIHYWNFNENVPGLNTNWTQPINATYGSGVLTYSFTQAYSYTGTTVNGIDGEVNGGSFVPRGGVGNINNGEYFLLDIPTTGFEDIVITYVTQRTSTGFTNQQVIYSLDGGETNVELTNVSTIPSSWGTVTLDFSDIPGADNNPNFMVGFILTGAGNESGNNRFDNIQVTGTQIAGGDLDTPELSIAMVGEQIQLSWTAVDGAVSYQVLHCDTPDGEFTQAAVVNAPATTWNIPSVTTKKFYQVIARDF